MAVKQKKPRFRDIILGGQDGIVNVLGVTLGVAAATPDLKIIIISGLAATFAESISMAAVAYTSTEADEDDYKSKELNEVTQIEKTPREESEEVRNVFKKWDFDGELLEEATRRITSDKTRWKNFMMTEELDLSKEQIENPVLSSVVVGLSSLVGSFLPIIPFFVFRDAALGSYGAVATCFLALFIIGMVKAKETVGNPFKSGAKIALIGMGSALVGYLIGFLLGGVTI